MNSGKAGFVVAIDGPDGAGKSTQVTLLAEYFKKRGETVHITRTSGGTPIGEALRKVSLNPELSRSGRTDLFISLAMSQALSEDIEPRKSRGQFVIIDRSPLAFAAYNGYGSQMKDKEGVLRACLDTVRLLQIDLLVYLTADQQILDERRKHRGNDDFFERKGTDFHKRVRAGYEVGLKRLNQANLVTRIVEVNAQPDEETVHRTILKALE